MKKEKSVRTTISITPAIYKKAQEIMEARSFPDFSGMLHQLIREEYDRRVDRESWLVNTIADAFGLEAEDVRRKIDAKMGRKRKRGGGGSVPVLLQ